MLRGVNPVLTLRLLISESVTMKHIYTLLCLFVPTVKSIFRFACLTDDELRENLYEMDDMIARHLLIGRR